MATGPVEPRIARAIHLAHPAASDHVENLVRPSDVPLRESIVPK